MIYGNLNDNELCKKNTNLYLLIMLALQADEGANLGRVEILTDKIYANFDQSKTENESLRKLEYHKDYLDVHIMLSGIEKIGFRSTKLNENDELLCSFDETKDLGFVKDKGTINYLALAKNDYVIFFPKELHKPLCSVESDIEVRKIVLKVHKDYLI